MIKEKQRGCYVNNVTTTKADKGLFSKKGTISVIRIDKKLCKMKLFIFKNM